MSNSITKTDSKKEICLQYLGISARKFADSTGDYDEAIRQLKTMHHYLDLAIEYGCSEREMMFALGYSRERFDALMRQVSR